MGRISFLENIEAAGTVSGSAFALYGDDLPASLDNKIQWKTNQSDQENGQEKTLDLPHIYSTADWETYIILTI